MIPGPSQSLTPPCILLIGLLGSHRSTICNRVGAVHACALYKYHILYLRLCFIKVIVLSPSSVCFSAAAKYLSCFLVFFVVTAMHACVYCVACVNEDAIQCNQLTVKVIT